MSTVTRNDIVAAIQQAMAKSRLDGPEGMTANELSAALHIPVNRMRVIGAELVRAGKLRPVRLLRSTQFGVTRPQWGYQLPERKP